MHFKLYKIKLVPPHSVSSGFIEFVVMPAFDVCSEMLDLLLETKTSQAAADLGIEGFGGKERAWVAPLADNRRRWKEQCQSSARGKLEGRARVFKQPIVSDCFFLFFLVAVVCLFFLFFFYVYLTHFFKIYLF